MPKASEKKPPKVALPQYGKSLTIGFGIVNVAVKMKPLTETARPVSGHGLCPDHGDALASVSLCSAGTKDEHVLERGTKVMGYPHPDDPSRWVVVDPETVKSLSEARDGMGTIKRVVDVAAIDSTFTEKAWVLWPQPGQEQAFDMLAGALAANEKAALVDVVIQKQTETLAVRWHEELEVLVAESIRHEQKIRYADAELVRQAAVDRPAVDEKMLEVASSLLATLDGEFDAAEAQDTWTPLMHDAIRAADKGEVFVATATPAPEPVVDLMAALTASVLAATPDNLTAKPKKRAPAKKKAA